MLYLSQILTTPVEDAQGNRTGKIIDVLVPLAQVGSSRPAYPSALLIEGEAEQPCRAPLEAIEWQGAVLRLRVSLAQLPLQVEEPVATEEVSLAHQVLDRQVIDIVRKKTVRVNDVGLGDDWQILGVDNSTFGLVRRLAPAWLLGVSARRAPARLIPWANIELIEVPEHEEERGEPVEVAPSEPRTPSGHLAELHPADIAEIVHQLTPEEGARLIEELDNETAADAMEEVDTDRQRRILENIEPARAADILEAMGPDEAADLLARLPEERAEELLRLMTPEESEDVQELLGYEESSAGGLMTTDYVALNQDRSAGEALEAVRSIMQEQDIRPAYVYCVPDETQDECKLLGVVSIWDLLAASPTQRLRDIMETDLVTVQPDTDPHTVAQVMAKYNLLAVPVVNEAGILEGIVTVDDALDVLLPPEKRRKPTRMY